MLFSRFAFAVFAALPLEARYHSAQVLAEELKLFQSTLEVQVPAYRQ